MNKFITRLLIIYFLFVSPACAIQRAHIDYDGVGIDYEKIDEGNLMSNAARNMLLWQNTEDKELRQKYMREALGCYYILSKMRPSDVGIHVNIARMYDEMNKYTMAKEYFYRATNIDVNNANANYYFGDFYFKRADYRRALVYYLIALNNGYVNNYKLNSQLAIIYEKIGDIRMAKNFYERAYKLNPSDETLPEKIRLLDELKYDDSQYYLFDREK